MLKCKVCVVMLVLVAAAIPAIAQDHSIPKSRTIYIEKMENDLDGFIRAEFVKQRVPLHVVLTADEGDLMLAGSSTADENRPWHEGFITGTRDHATGNVMVVDKKSNAMLWAGEAGDRNWFWGSMRRGGQRKVAERLVNDLKKAIH